MPISKHLAPSDERLLALHAAIEVEALWKALHSLLSEVIPCDRVTLFLGHIGMHEARKVFTHPPLPDNDRDYYTRRAAASPFNEFIENNVGIDLYRFSDIVGDHTTFSETSFYTEFAEPEGWRYGLSGLVWFGSAMRGMFSLYRGGEGTSDFSEEEMAILRELLPMISIALDRVSRLHRERLYRAVLEDFNRNMPVGLLLLDWNLDLIYANTEAMRLTAAWNFGPDASKKYNAREVFELPKDLKDSCKQLRERILEQGEIGVKNLSKTPVIVDSCPDTLRCSTQAIRLNSVNIAYPGFFISIEDAESERSSETNEMDAEKLLLLNQLTPSERELALLVSEGLSNREIAEQLSKSILTVKKQLNSVFGKLNIGSRARLIALLH